MKAPKKIFIRKHETRIKRTFPDDIEYINAKYVKHVLEETIELFKRANDIGDERYVLLKKTEKYKKMWLELATQIVKYRSKTSLGMDLICYSANSILNMMNKIEDDMDK